MTVIKYIVESTPWYIKLVDVFIPGTWLKYTKKKTERLQNLLNTLVALKDNSVEQLFKERNSEESIAFLNSLREKLKAMPQEEFKEQYDRLGMEKFFIEGTQKENRKW